MLVTLYAVTSPVNSPPSSAISVSQVSTYQRRRRFTIGTSRVRTLRTVRSFWRSRRRNYTHTRRELNNWCSVSVCGGGGAMGEDGEESGFKVLRYKITVACVRVLVML